MDIGQEENVFAKTIDRDDPAVSALLAEYGNVCDAMFDNHDTVETAWAVIRHHERRQQRHQALADALYMLATSNPKNDIDGDHWPKAKDGDWHRAIQSVIYRETAVTS